MCGGGGDKLNLQYCTVYESVCVAVFLSQRKCILYFGTTACKIMHAAKYLPSVIWMNFNLNCMWTKLVDFPKG